ncbi:unnamed protein product [Notodromas monacha]|uniref:N-glycosylase/DNA lyase n=1 Tax=Notodromas monacha TaxID=399045 RepID=A0A7R9BFT5_9CRUS|nr:unnamed protein product [Notodromas monacha]CAG0914477.1 unnamed protein product [Notodromas monacha]
MQLQSKATKGKEDQWERHLQESVRAYNITPHATTNQTPTKVMFGLPPCLNADDQFQVPDLTPEKQPQWPTAESTKAREEVTNQANKQRNRHFRPGEMVAICPRLPTVNTHAANRRFRVQKLGPYMVLSYQGNSEYRIGAGPDIIRANAWEMIPYRRLPREPATSYRTLSQIMELEQTPKIAPPDHIYAKDPGLRPPDIHSSLIAAAASGAVQLTESNIDAILASNDIVFINFYADWCRFSNMLEPVWNEAADKLVADLEPGAKAVMGRVDCDKEGNVARRYHISKYPTLKLIKFGQLAKREYRGQRSAEAFVSFVKEQIRNPIAQFKNLDELKEIEKKKRHIIGYYESDSSPAYMEFKKLGMHLKDDCDFLVTFEPVPVRPLSGNLLTFRPPHSDGEKDEVFAEDYTDFQGMLKWATARCIPLVREITFENAEELTEEGLPFLILFHHPDDEKSVALYNDIVLKELLDEKEAINFLTADGLKFKHPLHHLGKTESDLPLIAIDSFRHMYLFPDASKLGVPGAVKTFLSDLHSGKLHREFHYGPDPVTDSNLLEVAGNNQDAQKKVPTSPPESTFKKLAPSKNRSKHKIGYNEVVGTGDEYLYTAVNMEAGVECEEGPPERIVMTPRGKTSHSTVIMMERTRLSDAEISSSGAHVGGGDNQGLIIKKKAPEEFVDMPLPALTLEFCVFLVNQNTQKHTQESRTLRFWFREGVGEHDQQRCAQSFFTDLVNPADFPRADLSMDESGYEARALSEQKVLEMIESSYPNPISAKDMATQTHSTISAVEDFVDALSSRGLVRPVGPEGAGLYTRVTQDDSDVQVVRQMPTIASTAQPTIAIITANYCEKLAVDSMIENKQTYVRYNTVGESNVYTLGNIGVHRVVCTKLPTVGHTRNAMIAAGNTTTRLLGTFQQVEFVFLCGVAGGVPHYTDGNAHVRLGDVVVSGLKQDGIAPDGRNKRGVYVYLDAKNKKRRDEEADEVQLSLDELVAEFEAKSWQPPSLELQELCRKLKEHWEAGGQAPWLKYLEQGEQNWLKTAQDTDVEISTDIDAVCEKKTLRPPAHTDRLYMSIGQMDVIEVQHPALPDPKFEGIPRIHIGTVGCGREVINGGSQLRREIASRHGIRAFDSEFDQVLESIVGNRKDCWVAIRGIADYRDGTRGKEWQPYAALAAAAFMKTLVCTMDVARHYTKDQNGLIEVQNKLAFVMRSCAMVAKQAWHSFKCSKAELNLAVTLKCGQSFRWKQSDDVWIGVVGQELWKLRQDEESISFQVLFAEDEKHQEMRVKDYFRMDFNLVEAYCDWGGKDVNFGAVCKQFPGVRMLRQDPVENVFSFICSSNNNIERISQMVEKLCVNYGDPLRDSDGEIYYTFPTIEALCKPGVESKLRTLGFGYRAGYIAKSADKIVTKGGRDWLLSLRKLDYQEAHKSLLELTGVGAKVADCICLMSLDHLEAVPVDTHVFQIAARDYLPELRGTKTVTSRIYSLIGDHFRDLYGLQAGWAHSVLFSADLRRFADLKSAEVCALVPVVFLVTFDSALTMVYKCGLSADEPTYTQKLPVAFPYSLETSFALIRPCGCDLPDPGFAGLAIVTVGCFSMLWLMTFFTVDWLEFAFGSRPPFRFFRFVVCLFVMMGWLGGTVIWGVGMWYITSVGVSGFQATSTCTGRLYVLEAGSDKSFVPLYLALVTATVNFIIWAKKSWIAFDESLRSITDQVRFEIAAEEEARKHFRNKF